MSLSEPVEDGPDDVVDEAEKQKHPEQQQVRKGLVVQEGVTEQYGREKEAAEDAGHGWSGIMGAEIPNRLIAARIDWGASDAPSPRLLGWVGRICRFRSTTRLESGSWCRCSGRCETGR